MAEDKKLTFDETTGAKLHSDLFDDYLLLEECLDVLLKQPSRHKRQNDYGLPYNLT